MGRHPSIECTCFLVSNDLADKKRLEKMILSVSKVKKDDFCAKKGDFISLKGCF